jgi:hypothetical protein
VSGGAVKRWTSLAHRFEFAEVMSTPAAHSTDSIRGIEDSENHLGRSATNGLFSRLLVSFPMVVMRFIPLAIALVLLCFVGRAQSNSYAGSILGNSITMIAHTPSGPFEVNVTYGTDANGDMQGSISYTFPGSPPTPKTKFTYLSYSLTGLEAYWGGSHPGNLAHAWTGAG